MGDLSGYTVKYVNPNVSDPTIHAPTYGHTNCTIYSGDQDASGDSHRLAFQMNLEAGQAVLATSRQARAAHFIGCITNMFPSRRDEFLRLAGRGGYRFTIVRVPSGLDNVTHIAPTNRIQPGKAFAIFGYLVLTLFKQIDENSYQRYTDKMLKGLFAVVSYEVAEEEDRTIFNDISHEKTYRIIFGQNFWLRKRITECVIIEEKKKVLTSPLGGVCSYVCSILAWHEMTTLNLIVETLLITRSPLLIVPELRAEILNVEKAVKAVLASSMPQFFRILRPTHETQVMMRENFPRLAAIAAKLKGYTETSARHVVDSGKLEEWVNIHKNGMPGQVGQRNFFQTMDYLTRFSPADED